MTTVLIHGNPETDAIWTDLVCDLTDRSVTDLVLLSPPGFGASIPDGWGATQLEYRDWLIAELEDLTSGGNPVDLVGHDWGPATCLASWLPDLTSSTRGRVTARALYTPTTSGTT